MSDVDIRCEISRVDDGVNERDTDACQGELPPEQRENEIPDDEIANHLFLGWNVIEGEHS